MSVARMGARAALAAVGVLVAMAFGAVSASAETAEVIKTIPVGEAPIGVSSDGSHAWVTNAAESDKSVSEIEAASGKVINTIPVGRFPSAVSSDGIHVWVANFESDTVSEIEASSGKVINTIPV